MKTVIEIEDDVVNDEVVVTYKFLDELGVESQIPLEDRTPAIEQGVAVVNFLQLLVENPIDGVSHAETIH